MPWSPSTCSPPSAFQYSRAQLPDLDQLCHDSDPSERDSECRIIRDSRILLGSAAQTIASSTAARSFISNTQKRNMHAKRNCPTHNVQIDTGSYAHKVDQRHAGSSTNNDHPHSQPSQTDTGERGNKGSQGHPTLKRTAHNYGGTDCQCRCIDSPIAGVMRQPLRSRFSLPLPLS